MTNPIEARQTWLETEVDRLGRLAVLAMPTVLTVVALVLPMFREVVPSDREGESITPDGPLEQSTLVGLVLDAGDTGPTTAIRVTALVVVLGLLVSIATVGPWVRERTRGPGVLMLVGSGAALLGALTLWQLTRHHDDAGRLGPEIVDPTFQLLLAIVVPAWFLVARARSARW